jgi:hypothetical protein
MSRELETLYAAELAKQGLAPVRFVEFEIRTGSPPATDYARFWSGQGPFIWDSKTWTGVGIFGGISAITETRELRAVGIQIVLSGIRPEDVSTVRSEAKSGLPVRVWEGALNSSGVVVGTPYESFSGRTDTAKISMDGISATLIIGAESDLIRLQNINKIRMTHGDQENKFPGDEGFDFVEGLQDKQLAWGTPTPGGATGNSLPDSLPPPSNLYQSFFP